MTVCTGILLENGVDLLLTESGDVLLQEVDIICEVFGGGKIRPRPSAIPEEELLKDDDVAIALSLLVDYL